MVEAVREESFFVWLIFVMVSYGIPLPGGTILVICAKAIGILLKA